MSRYAWMSSALCAQADPDLWISASKGGDTRTPKRICGHCPVATECDAHAEALRAYDGHAMRGVWAGRSQRQRKQQRREMGEAA
jgi:WhiB family redox-sensing transcriptional regulator